MKLEINNKRRTVKNKRGFTLIELLAVIVILAVITLIATPIIINVIDDAKESAAVSKAKVMAQGIENYCRSEYYKKEINSTYTVICDTGGETTKTLSTEELNSIIDIPETTSLSITIDNKGKIVSGSVIVDGYQISATTFEATVYEDTPPCFTFNASTHTITSYNASCGTEVSIPAQIDGVTVENIGANAFQNKGITSLVMAEGILNIGNYAFANNSLTSLTTPSTIVQYGVGAFQHNNLITLYIDTPSLSCCYCTAIAADAFRYNLINQGSAVMDTRTIIAYSFSIDSTAFANNGSDGQTTISLESTSTETTPEKCA